MKLRYLSYPCTNVTLKLTTGRTLRLANLKEPRLSEVIRENLETLLYTLRWNVERGIHFFRIASSVIPLASHEAFPTDWRTQFVAELAEIRGAGTRARTGILGARLDDLEGSRPTGQTHPGTPTATLLL